MAGLIEMITTRTGKSATTGREIELLAASLLMDLCSLDDRDADAERD
jgi:hypothetical protein